MEAQAELPLPISNETVELVKQGAVALGIDPALACAIVEQESAWNTWAIRYEPAFYERYETNPSISLTERMTRACSWGLFQTMGQSVREIGYKGDLPALCSAEIGIQWGLLLFQRKLSLAGSDTAKALLFWNGGSNLQYPSQVLARVPKYQANPSSTG